MSSRFDAMSWMWSEALAALEHAERRRAQYFGLIGGRAPPKWEPPVDVYETEEGLTIVIALPGVASDAVSLFVDSQGLVVQTERVPTAMRACRRIHRMEIPYGAYERRIDLPAGRYTLQRQQMSDGCLELYLTRE
jgi:HSP20 family molecular chaperone IbpA